MIGLMMTRAATVLLLAALSSAPSAHAQETLVLHHFLSPNSPTHQRLLAPWAERIEAQSDGRLTVEIFPSMAMGGKPPELYRQVRDGAADVVWTLIGYTPGVFPRAEVFELPGVHAGSAEQTTRAIQDRFDLIADDFEDLHPILVHVHAGNALHMKEQAVRAPGDLAGLKLRTPSRTGAWMIEAFGGEPVGMPLPALPQALAKGVVDGALVPFEMVAPLKLQDLTEFSVEGAEGQRFGTAVFVFLMNKERYESLPEDLRAVIDANSGAALAGWLGDTWDTIEQPGRDAQADSGGEVIYLDADAVAAFDALAKSAADRWIAEADSKGLDGAALFEAAAAAVAGADTE